MVLLLKNLSVNAEDGRDMGLTPGLGRSSGEGSDNLLQDSCLKNSMDREASQSTVQRVAQSQIRLTD